MARAPSCSLTYTRLRHGTVTVGIVSSQEDILVEKKQLWQMSTSNGVMAWLPDQSNTLRSRKEKKKTHKSSTNCGLSDVSDMDECINVQ